jgi:hypothetical protein
MTTNTKPAATIRDGALKATIWRNTGDKGEFHSVRFTRTWKDEQGHYHDGDSFSGAELLRLAHLATKAYDEFASLRQTGEGLDADAETGK